MKCLELKSRYLSIQTFVDVIRSTRDYFVAFPDFSFIALNILEQERLCSQGHAMEYRLPPTNENEFEMSNTDETSAQAN